MKSNRSLTLFSTLLACSLFSSLTWADEQQHLEPFTIIPYGDLKDHSLPGRDYYLSWHMLRVQVTLKVTVSSKLKEDMDPNGPPPAAGTYPSFYVTTTVPELTSATLTTVRKHDSKHRYFMALGQVKSFFRDKKFDDSFSDDGFLSNASTTYEDKTLQILADAAKTAATLAMAAGAPMTDAEKAKASAEQREKAKEALRLKTLVDNIKNGIKSEQEALSRELAAAAPDLNSVKRLSDSLSALRVEQAAAEASRSSLANPGDKVEVLTFTTEMDPSTFVNRATRGPSGSYVASPLFTTAPEWPVFSEHVKGLMGGDAIMAVGTLLDATSLVLEFEPDDNPTVVPVQPPVQFPFQGIIYRRPLLASGKLVTAKSEVFGQTELAALKFGQLGQIVALPIKSYIFSKGDLNVTFNADGEINRMWTDTTAAGSAINTAALTAATDYQSYQKGKASGGFDTDLLTAETARLKAKIDNLTATKALHDLENPK